MVKQYCFERVNISCLASGFMSSDSNHNPNKLADGMIVRSEEIGFSAEELSPCPSCSRPNSPNRPACIYCGAVLKKSPLSVMGETGDDPLETWEHGFNVVFRPGERELDEAALVELSRLFSVETAVIDDVFGKINYVPLARFRNESVAEMFCSGLAEIGISGSIVPDEKLSADKPPVRIRSVEIVEDIYTFIDFNTASRFVVPAADLRLVVIGSKIDSRSETTWKKKRGSQEVVDDVIIESDQPLIDVYRESEDLGFRIQVNGFDFSVLGEAKGMIAGENMKLLADRLGNVSETCVLDDGYNAIRTLLDQVWSRDSEIDHMGPLRAGLTNRKKTKIALISNLSQFTKYSRLQRLSI